MGFNDKKLLNQKSKIARFAMTYTEEFFQLLKIDKWDKKGKWDIAVAFWSTPVIYNLIKKRFPNSNVYFIDDVNNCTYHTIPAKFIKLVDTDNKEYWPSMKFDKVIMNPPYEKNLHLKILNEVMSHLGEKGEVINLSPARWLQDPLASYKPNSDFNRYGKTIRQYINDIDIVPALKAQELFEAGVFTDLCILKLNKKGGYNTEQFSLGPYASIIKKLIIPFYKENGTCQANKLLNRDTSKPFVKVPTLHGHVGCKDMCEWVSPDANLAFSTELGKYHKTFNFKTKKEAKNFFNYLQLKPVKFILAITKTDMNVLWGILPYTNDYKEPWTDERFYDYFKLTNDEIILIETIMKEYM